MSICPASGKIMYQRLQAGKVASVLGHQTYECPECGAWHTSTDRTKKRKKRLPMNPRFDPVYCDCGWPLLKDGSCTNIECSIGLPTYGDEDEESEVA